MEQFWNVLGELKAFVGVAVVAFLVIVVTISIVDRHPREK